MHFYVRFRLFGASIALKTLKQIHLMHLNLKQRSKPRNKHPNTANVSITYNMSSKAYFDPKMLFLDRRTPQSDQNPKNFQFHQKQLKFPIDCATSHPNRPTELRDIIENRTFFLYKKKGCDRDTEYPFNIKTSQI